MSGDPPRFPAVPEPPSVRDERPARRVSLGAWAPALVVVLAFHVVWEGHGVIDPAFRNPDVAGIAYNARLLVTGGLPYLDSAEIKPPGAFLLFAPFLAVGGMRMVWAAATLWGAALSVATGALAAACFGRRAGPRAAVLHAAWAVLATDGDINYSFWMALPFTLAAACACSAATVTSPWRRRMVWALAGALALFAVAIKPSAWTLLGLFGVLVAREIVLLRSARAIEAMLAGVAGALGAAALIALPYAARGELKALALGLASVSSFGKDYVAVVQNAYGSRLSAVLRGMPCLVERLGGPLAFALCGCANLFDRRTRSPLVLGAVAFTLASLFGVAYTLRFFSHDDAQLLPALAIVAVRPQGLVATLLDRLTPFPRLAVVASAALGVGAGWHDYRQRRDYVHFMGERDHMIAGICERLAPILPPNEPVLAWGWHAWSVYEHCDRRAPGRVFKVLAHVTTVNTNTCNNGFGPIKLRSGPAPSRFFRELEQRPPSLFLWSTYFEEMGHDPLRQFDDLSTFLRDRYAVVDVRGPFVAMVRADLVNPERAATKTPATPGEVNPRTSIASGCRPTDSRSSSRSPTTSSAASYR
jgi:hypothetical protein